jgi:hypothetical protein
MQELSLASPVGATGSALRAFLTSMFLALATAGVAQEV